MTSIVVAGSLHLDLMVHAPGRPALGETMVGQSWSVKPGGKGCNQAAAAAQHGARVAMIGRVGRDDFGNQLLDHLRQHDVDTAYVGVSNDTVSGMSVALVEPSGDYSAVIVSGANLTLDTATIGAAKPLIEGAQWLLLQNEVPDEANLEAARIAKAAGVRVMLNAAPARSLPDDLVALLDILVVNALEAEALSGVVVSDLAQATLAAQALCRLVPNAIVTAGGDGVALARTGADPVALPAYEVKLLSTHGAGDTFVGALAARLVAGGEIVHALGYANAAAALLVATSDDARRGLRPADVERLLTESST